MITTAHILVLAQPEFVERQLGQFLEGFRPAPRRRLLERLLRA